MRKVATNITLDPELKKQAVELYNYLGLDLSTAISLFLSQSVLRGGLPFEIVVPKPNKETEKALKEADKIINGKKKTKSYTLDEFKKYLKEV